MDNNIIEIINQAKKITNENEIIDFWSKKENFTFFRKVKFLSFHDKEEFYKVYNDYFENLRNNFFIVSSNNLNEIFKELINLNVYLLIQLKKQGLKNFYGFYKDTYKYFNIKALELYRFLNDLGKIEEELLEKKEKLLSYLYKSYSIEKKGETIEILKGYFDRLFSTLKYREISSRNELIKNVFEKIENYKFFYEIENFQMYIKKYLYIEEKKEKENKYIEKVNNEENINFKEDRKDWCIGLVGGEKTIKNLKNFLKNKDKSNFLLKLGFNEDLNRNFEIIESKFEKQRKININVLKNRLYGLNGSEMQFILSFETDHNTKFHNLLSELDFSHRIIINDKPKQHFSFSTFKNMLLKGIEQYERSQNI